MALLARLVPPDSYALTMQGVLVGFHHVEHLFDLIRRAGNVDVAAWLGLEPVTAAQILVPGAAVVPAHLVTSPGLPAPCSREKGDGNGVSVGLDGIERVLQKVV